MSMTNRATRSELASALFAQWPVFARAGAVSLVAGLLSLAPTFYMLEVYDRVVTSRSIVTLEMLLILVLGLCVIMEILHWARAEIMLEASLAFDTQFSQRLFDASFRATLLKVKTSGMQVAADFRTLREFFVSPGLLAMMEVPLTPVCLFILFLIHPLVGWCALFGAALQGVVTWLTERRVQPHLAAANRAAIEAQMFAGSSVRNALVIESMGMLEHIHSRWLKRQRLFLGAQATASDHAAGLAATARSIQLLQGSVLLGLACWLLLAGEFPGGGGMMIVASVIGGIALRPLVQAIAHWKQFVAARDAFQRLDALLTQMPARPPQMPLPAPQGQLSVEAVTVGAPTGGGALPLPILRNVSFAIPKGECLGVIGPSASGKTTLARLLTGVWPAQSGNVRLDGVDVYSWNKAELGPHVGYLPEQVELFEGTLADNITRFGGVDQQKLEEAVRLVGLESWVAELPQAYDTQIGDEGTTLSAGQRQRVGLARAIYGNPCFVVLDEPNSNLDEQGENVLLELLRELKRRAVTCVIITHRVNVLSVVDSILVLRDGVVQGLGKRDEVLAALSAAAKGAVPSRGGGDALPAPARAEGAA